MNLTRILHTAKLHNGDLYDHQKKAIQVGLSHDGAALLMEPGTGKTLSSIAVIGIRHQAGQVKRVAVIAPKSVVPVWPKEFDSFAAFPYESFVVKKRNKFKSIPPFAGKVQVLVLTYQSSWERGKHGETKLWNELNQFKPDMVILDESHNIKNGRSLQSKILHKLGDRTKFRMILTGTPGLPLDYWSQYRFIDPKIFGYKFNDFAYAHARKGYWGGFKLRKGAEAKVAKAAHEVAYVVTKEQAKLNLPPVTNQFRYCELEGETLRTYHQLKEEMAVEFSELENITAPLAITKILRLQQIAGGFIHTEGEEGQLRQVGHEKLGVMEEILDELPKGKQLVVFCRFRPEVKAIADLARKRKLKTDIIMGKDKDHKDMDRGKTVEDFQAGKTQILVVQIRTGGVGITLTAADTAVFYSTGFSLIEYEQARSRLDRIGQTNPVTLIHIVAEDTVDEEIISSLAEKRNTAQLVVDILKKYIGGKKMSKFIEENPEIERRLKQLQRELENGLTVDLKPGEMPETQSGENPDIQITIIQGGKTVFKIGEDKESVKPERKSKKEKKAAPIDPADIITVKDLADEIGIDPTELRKRLRDSDLKKPSGRWEWTKDHADLKVIRAWK